MEKRKCGPLQVSAATTFIGPPASDPELSGDPDPAGGPATL